MTRSFVPTAPNVGRGVTWISQRDTSRTIITALVTALVLNPTRLEGAAMEERITFPATAEEKQRLADFAKRHG